MTHVPPAGNPENKPVPAGPFDMVDPADPTRAESSSQRSAGKIFLRGLAIALPSILTLVIILWLGGLVYEKIIEPVNWLVRWTTAQAVDASQPTAALAQWDRLPPLEFVDRGYRVTPDLKSQLERRRITAVEANQLRPEEPVPAGWLMRDDAIGGVYMPLGRRSVPYLDYNEVAQNPPTGRMPTSAIGIYMELVTTRYFGSTFTLSALAVLLAILAIYFIGRLVTIRLGAYLVGRVERDILGRLPVISNVYGSVKQVTDFLFTEQKVQYNRVVALEYPRKGIWSLGFVTGEGMRQTIGVAGEPLVNVLVPTSPMPVTGYTMSVPRSQVIDLDLSLDQAFQYIISCGVLVPPHQQSSGAAIAAVQQEVNRRLPVPSGAE